ncbi:MAG: MFS transporter [Pseudanabaenaceae cyanobacterium]
MPTQWIQVWSLAGVQGSITLCWVIYGAYLPKLLQQGLGIPEDAAKAMTASLLILENGLGILMEPLWGGLSDRLQRWVGTRMPVIIAGTILSAGLFVALPLLVINGGDPNLTKSLLAPLAVIWALAMTMFRSPAICMLGIFAMNTRLPQAMSLLTLLGGLAGSTRFFAQGVILSWGPLAAFGIGSGVLLAAVFFLQRMTAAFPLSPAPNLKTWAWYRYLLPLGLLLGLGLVMGWGTRLIFGEVFPRLVRTDLMPAIVPSLSFVSPDLISGSLALLGAIAALGMGQLSTIYANHLLMIGGCGIIALGMVVLMSAKGLWLLSVLILLIVVSYATIANGGIPLALGLLPHWGGLAIGTYFGGFGAANMSYGLLIPKPAQMLTLEQALIIAALMFLVGGFGVAITQRFTPPAVSESLSVPDRSLNEDQ